MASPRIPLVVHLIYRLDFGGLETLLAECINRMPADRYRHAIVCLTDYTEFSKKISRPDVEIFALHKAPGWGLGTHVTLWKLLRRLRPDILHTYNLAAIEYAFTATLAGVPIRIHAEHGRDAGDPDGLNPKHNLLRRLLTPFIDRYIPVSADLQRWLRNVVRIPDAKNTLIHNGVDTERFQPSDARTDAQPNARAVFTIGSVGRIQDVKNHRALIEAFIQLRAQLAGAPLTLKLVIVGDGPLLPAIKEQVAAAGIGDCVSLPGARTDVAALMPSFSVFALPSLAEGTPVTILEAMACGLPIVASAVGGIPEIVSDQVNGRLVPAADTAALSAALAFYCQAPDVAARHGAAGRAMVLQNNSLQSMLTAYLDLYDALCARKIHLNGKH